MKLLLIGCEYAGKTTLVNAISQWIQDNMGAKPGVHDHFTIPHIDHEELTDQEQRQFLDLSPRIKETFQRYGIDYHFQTGFYEHDDHILVGFHIEEAIYAELYYNYGKWGQEHDRWRAISRVEGAMLEQAPDTTLVLLKASAEVIAQRMKESPHKNGVVQEKDIPRVLQMFQKQYESSRLKNKITLDTSKATADRTLAEFLERMEPYLSVADRLRILVQKAKQKGQWV